MSAGGDRLVLLLPERRRLAGPLDPAIARAFGRGTRLPDDKPGESAQLHRAFFAPLDDDWAMAPIMRAFDCDDVGDHAWLRADPAFVRAEMSGARLMACGDMGLASEEVDAFIAELRPLFDDAGMVLSAGHPGRWYLRLPAEAQVPAFGAPSEALGADVLAFMPAGAEGRPWRALANEAQVLLHNHPRNARRLAEGLLPVNSLWFWGGGLLPPAAWPGVDAVVSEDDEVRALAKFAARRDTPGESGSVLLDLRHERDFARLQAGPLADALAALGRRYASVDLDFADGACLRLRRADRWRLWRRGVDVRA